MYWLCLTAGQKKVMDPLSQKLLLRSAQYSCSINQAWALLFLTTTNVPEQVPATGIYTTDDCTQKTRAASLYLFIIYMIWFLLMNDK